MMNKIGTYFVVISFIIVVSYFLEQFIEQWLILSLAAPIKIAVILFLTAILFFLGQFLVDSIQKKDKYEDIEK